MKSLNQRGGLDFTLTLVVIAVLLVGGVVLYRVVNGGDDNDTANNTSQTEPAETAEPKETQDNTFCDGHLEGDVPAGWEVEENVALKVGISQQKCELHRADSDFEISISEVTGAPEELANASSSGLQVGGQWVIDRNEELTMADGKVATAVDNKFTGHSDSRSGHAQYYVKMSDNSGVSFFYVQSDTQPDDSEIDELITSFSVPS